MTEDPPRSRPPPQGDLHTPFVALPERTTLFARRADQFEVRAEGHELAPYLRFLAELARVQAALMSDLPALAPIAEEVVARATANGMPPIDRARLINDPALMETVARFLEAAVSVTMPAAAVEALAGLRADPHTWRPHLANALEDAVAAEGVAAHIFIASAVQVHATRLAALLPAEMLKPVGTGACPSCGGAPVSSVLVDRPGAHHARYGVCATCATQWNAVRVICVLCGANAGIAYHHIEGHDDGISAETCESCHGYVKLMSQADNHELDPVVDDVASLGLDLMLQNAGWRRGGVNPFLAGY